MIGSYAVDKIIIKKFMGRGDWQEKNTEKTIEIRGYVENGTKLIRNLAGEEVITHKWIRVSKYRMNKELVRNLNHEDRVNKINNELIDRAILNIILIKDFYDNHYEVYLA